jgi:hemolysin activation/secretion protein
MDSRRKMKKAAFITLIFIAVFSNTCFSETPSMGQIQKSQQDLELDKSLRLEAEKGQKVLIKKIIVKGATLITEDQIKQVILPFKNHWLTQSDIELILSSVANIYKQNGCQGEPARISYEVKEGNLEVNIEEKPVDKPSLSPIMKIKNE